ncbi:MAG TPA: DUF481 domain-containing protein [Fimbriimonadaceae bacterium]|nr:DUF481 domain-containing protein [Fimbriimonadaceae bacterium]
MRPLLVLPVFVCAAIAWPDVVTLQNGDRLTGKVETMTGGFLSFATELAGKVKIDVQKIKSIETVDPVTLVLPNGEKVQVAIKGIANGQLLIENKEIDISWLNVISINPPNPKAPDTPKWTGSLTSNFGLTRSDREAQNFDINADAKYKRDRQAWQARGSYYNARQSDSDGKLQTTRDAWYARGQYDFFVQDRRFYYGNLRFDHDAIKDLDLRTVAGAGAGFTLVKNEKTNYRIEIGGSWVDERYQGGDRTDTLGMQFGSGLNHRINGSMTLSHDLTFVADPGKIDDYLLVSDFALRSALNRAMFSELRFVFDYDPTPREGSRKDNYRYVMGLGFRF